MNKLSIKQRASVLLIIMIAILVRLPNINAPITDAHVWRQSLTATIARNFVLEDANILHPKQSEVLPETNFERYVFLEFPVYQYSVSLLYRLFGFYPWVPRVVTIFSAIIVSLSIYGIGTMLFSHTLLPLVAALLFHIFPVSYFYGRAVLPDMTMVAFLITGLFYLTRFIHTEKQREMLLAAGFISLAVIIKPYSLIYLPLFPTVLFASKGNRIHLSAKTFLQLFIVCCIVVFPYLLWAMYFVFSFPDAIPSDHMQGMVGWGNTTIAEFTHRMRINFSYELFTSPGSFIIGAGMLITYFNKALYTRHRLFMLVWTLCATLYLVTVAAGNAHHHYYQLPLVPLAALYAAIFIDFIIRTLKLLNTHPRIKHIAVGAMLLVFSVVYMRQFTRLTSDNFYSSVSYYHEIPQLKKILPKDSLLVVSGHLRDPTFLDLADRKGWPFNSELLEADTLTEEFRHTPIPTSVLPENSQNNLLMPAESYYRYLLPFITRKKELGATYLILLSREMPNSYNEVVRLAGSDFSLLYHSDEAAIFDIR